MPRVCRIFFVVHDDEKNGAGAITDPVRLFLKKEIVPRYSASTHSSFMARAVLAERTESLTAAMVR